MEQVALTGKGTELHPTPDELHGPELQTTDPDLAAAFRSLLDHHHDQLEQIIRAAAAPAPVDTGPLGDNQR